MSDSIDRRQFLQSATLAATAATAVSGAVAGAPPPPQAKPLAKTAQPPGPLTRRWTEQRWLLDNTIRSVGMDWDQPRSAYLSAPCGPQATADFALVRSRIQKYADAAPAFEAVAKRREGVARAALDTGDTITARENYFMAAVPWGAAQWPHDQADAPKLGFNPKKRRCYGAYPEIAENAAQKIGISGNSVGSFFAPIAAAHEPRLAAVAVSAVCHEPGFHTIFEEASPTFKMRFMFMSGFADEARFDEFRKIMTWEGHAERVRVPYLCMAGEHDELSPLEHTERLMKTLKGPKRWVVYQDSRHSVGGVPSANLGPNPPGHVADWILASLNGKTSPSEKWFVTATGQIVKTPL